MSRTVGERAGACDGAGGREQRGGEGDLVVDRVRVRVLERQLLVRVLVPRMRRDVVETPERGVPAVVGVGGDAVGGASSGSDDSD